MVGIVIVSHSAQLAAGVQELAHQMVQGAVRSAIAAGIDDPENPFGTDVMQVTQAIELVYSDDGVVVLMDLGSAVLSAEMALEFLPEEWRSKVRLCEAPLVEGAIAAAVQAAAGADIEQVLAEARGALAAKTAQLGMTQMPPSGICVGGQMTNDQRQQTTEIHLTIQNYLGLHARPAAKLVAIAAQFQSHITLQNLTSGSESVNAKSINQVVTLGVRQGHQIAITVVGADADAALTALQQLVEANFGEEVGSRGRAESVQKDSLAANSSPASLIPNLHAASQLNGIPASPGITMGAVIWYHPDVPDVVEQLLDDPQMAWEQLQQAIQTAKQEIQSLRHYTARQVGASEAAIFDAHLLYLEDPTLIERLRLLIFDQCLSAATAWRTVIDETVSTYQNLEDSYLQARGADVADVGRRVLVLLMGTAPVRLDLSEPGILLANDLTPSQTAQLDPSKVLGICTIQGGATSHTGILARSLGIPAVVGVGVQLLSWENGTFIALDGETGQVWIQPDDTQQRELQAKQDQLLATQQAARAAAQQPAITSDHHHIKLMANIYGIADAQTVVEAGADGVGLLRSEFLYLDRVSAPTEEEQLAIYQAIASLCRPLIIRTLDIGGDKTLSYLNLPPEANPFLGWRGIRLLLDCPDLLKTQLRAILRASYGNQIKVMFPMIASVKEIRAAKQILATAQVELRQAGIPFDAAMAVGIMVEVPAAVTVADRLAAEVDFFSIGTNDLSQYVMAADRTNPRVAILADAFEPAVLRMIEQTVKAAHNASIWVGVCGELASSTLATPILLGLGVDELSMNPPAIPAVKAAISGLTMEKARAIAREVLQLDSADTVKDYVVCQMAGTVAGSE